MKSSDEIKTAALFFNIIMNILCPLILDLFQESRIDLSFSINKALKLSKFIKKYYNFTQL